jgi:hypothetical protein
MKKLVVIAALGTILTAPAFARQSHRDVRGSDQEQSVHDDACNLPSRGCWNDQRDVN